MLAAASAWVCGGWDGGVMSWRAINLAEDDARQQASTTFNPYEQLDQADHPLVGSL